MSESSVSSSLSVIINCFTEDGNSVNGVFKIVRFDDITGSELIYRACIKSVLVLILDVLRV